MSDTSLAFNFLKGRDSVSPHMKKVGDNATTMASRITASSVLSVAATATMVAGWASLAAQGVAAVSAVAPLLGLVALVPAVTIAAAGGITTLVMAFSGLGAAMKQTTGSAGASGQAIAAAERRVEMAQRAATQAQQGLNDAREIAAQRLVDLSRLLAHAALDERAATLAVADAQKQLRAARSSGDRSAVTHAQLALDEAVMSLEDVKLHTEDLRKEEEKRTTAGVEGSDEVLTAMQQQADAMRSLADAQVALAAAGKGSGGVDAAAAAYAKLSLAGKQLVDVLKVIGPSWRGVQQAVQQSVFAGVAGDVKDLSTIYLPIMGNQLPAIGQGWNNAFRGVAQLAKTDGFIRNINITLGNTATFWQSIGRSFAPFLSGFMQFATVGSTFLPGIGSWVERSANAFERWATAAADSGRAQGWIQNALTVLSQVWEIAKNLGTSIVAIFKAGDAGPGWLPGMVAGTQALSDFLNSPAGQGKLEFVFSTLRDVGSALWAIITNLGPALLDLAPAAGGTLVDGFSVAGVVVSFLADHLDLLAKALPFLAAGFLIVKGAQVISTIASVADVPVRIWQSVVMWRHTNALKANTAAMATNTTGTKKGIVAMAAAKVAGLAQAAWTGIVTAAQWLWNIAMTANPIGLVVLAIVLLIAGIVLLWQNSSAFRDFFIGLWDHIWSFMKMIGNWFAGPFVDFFVGAWNWIKGAFNAAVTWIAEKILWVIETVAGIKEKIKTVAAGLWDGIVNSFKAAINWMLRLWNDFHLTLGGGTILGVSIPSITLDTPNIPYLAEGGIVPATPGGRLIVAGEGGQDEAVVPLSKLGSMGGGSAAGGPQEIVLKIELIGPGDMKRMIRKIVRVDGGGSVQVAFGQS